MPRDPKEVFISHSSREMTRAVRLVSELRRHGVKSFYSPHNLRGAQDWHDEIGGALRRCDWFIVLLTPASLKSMWVKRELVYALSERRYWKRIVPLLFKPCNVDRFSWALRPSQFIDFTGDFDHAFRKLLSVWSIDWKRPPKPNK